MSSLHGLWFCIGYDETKHNSGYHVLNPTTKQFVTIPNPHHDEAADKLALEGLHFAYDPLKSPHYKVVCIWSTTVCIHEYPFQYESYFQIEIYSSQTKTWRISGEKFTTIAHHTIFREGVYWNGAINWLDCFSSIYFNVDEERIGDMPMVPIPEGEFWYDSQHLYCGESRGHLHFVEIYEPTVLFNVYELKKDYSEWFVKYRVDLATIANNFPEMTEINGHYELISILRDDDGSFMVLHMPNKFVKYNLVHKGYKVICEYEGSPRIRGNFYSLNIYPYIESLCDLC